jgi:hypothetical protein
MKDGISPWIFSRKRRLAESHVLFILQPASATDRRDESRSPPRVTRSKGSRQCGRDFYGNKQIDRLEFHQANGLVRPAVFISRFPVSLAERIGQIAAHRRVGFEAPSQGE